MHAYMHRAGGIDLASPVLARPVFLKVKVKFHFSKRQVINKSASVILGLIKTTIIDRKGISRSAKLSAAHAFHLLLCSQGILLCKSYVINKVVCDFLTFYGL